MMPFRKWLTDAPPIGVWVLTAALVVLLIVMAPSAPQGLDAAAGLTTAADASQVSPAAAAPENAESGSAGAAQPQTAANIKAPGDASLVQAVATSVRPGGLRTLIQLEDLLPLSTPVVTPKGASSGISTVVLPLLSSTGGLGAASSASAGAASPEADYVAAGAAGHCLRKPFADQYERTIQQNFPYGSSGGGQYELHTGVDILNNEGTPVLAAADGQVDYAGTDEQQVFGRYLNYYGNLIAIRVACRSCEQPLYVLYGHLSSIKVQTGQTVHAGDVVGEVGMTGIAIGPHLHVEVRVGANSYESTRNPELYLCSVAGAGRLVAKVTDQSGALLPNERVAIYKTEPQGELSYLRYTYLAEPAIHSDPGLGENLVVEDMPEGEYTIDVGCGQSAVEVTVRITAGQSTSLNVPLPSAAQCW